MSMENELLPPSLPDSQLVVAWPVGCHVAGRPTLRLHVTTQTQPYAAESLAPD